MEILDSSENTTSLYSVSTLGSTEDYYYDAATEFDTASEDLEDREDNSLWQLEEGCDLQLLHLLPLELLNRVLTFCSPTMLCHLGRCSTQTLALTSQSFIWRDLMLRHYGPDIVNGLYTRKKLDFETLNGSTSLGVPKNDETSDISEAVSSLASRASNASTISEKAGASNRAPTLSKVKSNMSLMDLVLEELEEDLENWEEWKEWYRDIHRRAGRLIRFDVRGGIKELIDHHGLPNTTGAISRTLKCCMSRIASYALRDFLHQLSNINLASYFLRLWNFKGISVLQMMRLVLGFVRLPRSDSSMLRILEILALAWWEQNCPTAEDEAREAEAAAASTAASSSNGGGLSTSPPSSPTLRARIPLPINNFNQNNQVLPADNADGEIGADGHQPRPNNANENGEATNLRRNAARIMQAIHLTPLETLESANPWEQIKVPVILTEEELKPRGGFFSVRKYFDDGWREIIFFCIFTAFIGTFLHSIMLTLLILGLSLIILFALNLLA